MSHDVKGTQKGPSLQCMLVRLSKVRHYLASTDLSLNPQNTAATDCRFILHPALSRLLGFALVFGIGLFKLLLFSAHRDCLILIYTALTLCLLYLKDLRNVIELLLDVFDIWQRGSLMLGSKLGESRITSVKQETAGGKTL